ncbi:uncharacterized protein K452DRAFT_255113 [Aplosporella prunicola CBS 121167]|uniref:DUF1682-domain-containing protein n=1 Tax=Aplosporella prunicola CBS 121167 TaxID=1176127 RepID=A0A6A6B4U1_9PEZI|nr:uncharacterized protein K452DRAFT_255113 [Aplosporella prunicola CBS 121167]KAF2139050.1 hypothetical protein K452DRAFT_255113 [Aplosporella prunicola CBS 121167]
MAGNFFNNLLGSKSSSTPVPAADDADFADFAGAPDPSPASISPITASSAVPQAAIPTGAARPYTKWYRVWERTTLADFYQEAFILPLIILIVVLHAFGKRANRRKATSWVKAHTPALQQEFAHVGFGGPKLASVEDVQSTGLAKLNANELVDPETLLKEVAANEFQSYATGRQNVAFLDVKISLLKRYNPLIRYGEAAMSFFLESVPASTERVEATAYSFDGKEIELVPGASKTPNSTYDGFVWAIVHKDMMKRLRDERYDLSLTTTKDHPKLPIWYTIMSESAEISEALLTPELLKAVDQAGDALEALVVSDQPMDQPKKLDETVSRKRVTLSLTLPSNDNYANTLPLFQYFLRMPDHLVNVAHFRPEAMRRVKQTRDDEIRKIKKLDEEGRAEERKLEADKAKKLERERKLKNLSADEQRKYLEKEREKDLRRSQRRKVMKA